MNDENTNYLKQHIDILSFRDLAPGTITTYSSYMTQFIEWTESLLSSKPLSDISWEELRSYIRFLKEVRELNPRTVNVHIAQLRDFYQYILHRDWDRYQILMQATRYTAYAMDSDFICMKQALTSWLLRKPWVINPFPAPQSI